jgi:prolyl oligopeptidase PreP (S9A serine peptidase family)
MPPPCGVSPMHNLRPTATCSKQSSTGLTTSLIPIDVAGGSSTFGRTMPIRAACGERLASFRSKTPAWDLLLDLDELAAQEGEDWVWQGGATLPPAHERAIIYLSRGGSDAVVLREFDLSSHEFVPDGFYLPESRSSIVWLDRDTLLLSSSLGAGMATRSGLARTIRLWRRGTYPLAAPVIFETREDSAVVVAEVDRDASPERVWFIEHTSNLHAIHWLGDRSGETADHLDGWRHDVCAGHRPRYFACSIPRRRPPLHDAVPA